MTLSFLNDILGTPDVLDVSSLPFLKNHVFFDQLRGKEHDLSRLAGAAETVTDERVTEMMEAIPPEWRSERAVSAIRAHLQMTVGGVDKVIGQIGRVLA